MRSVQDLTPTELEELRSRWFAQHEDDGSLNEVMNIDDVIELSETDIPMGVVIDYYRGTFFVEDDFWCNNQD